MTAGAMPSIATIILMQPDLVSAIREGRELGEAYREQVSILLRQLKEARAEIDRLTDRLHEARAATRRPERSTPDPVRDPDYMRQVYAYLEDTTVLAS
jgi:hypothetical protein